MGKKNAEWRYRAEEQINDWTTTVGGRFEGAYQWLRATTGFRSPVCFLGAWLSLSDDDRGPNLHTIKALANWLGVAPSTLHNWRNEYQLDEWAEQMRLTQLRGEQLGEVDRITYLAAIDPEKPVDARRLFYQRAGVLGQDITIRTKTQKETMKEWLFALRALDGEVDDDIVPALTVTVLDAGDVVGKPGSGGTK